MAQIFYFPRLRHGGRRPRPASPSRPIQSTSCSRRPAFVRALRAGLGISCRSLVDWIRLSKRLSQVVFFWNPSTRRCPWFMNFSMCDLSAVLSSEPKFYTLSGLQLFVVLDRIMYTNKLINMFLLSFSFNYLYSVN
jgi:hypothetical protein